MGQYSGKILWKEITELVAGGGGFCLLCCVAVLGNSTMDVTGSNPKETCRRLGLRVMAVRMP